MEKDKDVSTVTKVRIVFTSNIKVGHNNFFIQTENLGVMMNQVVTKVYKAGDLVLEHTEEYPKPVHPKDLAGIEDLIKQEHSTYFSLVKSGKFKEGKKAMDFLEDAKMFLRRKKYQQALDIVKAAREMYPDDPFVMTYYGHLMTVVRKKPEIGVEECRRAIEMLKITMPQGKETHFPTFYHNLSLAYLAAGKRSMAVETVFEGIKHEKEGGKLHKQLEELGIRRRPPIPFLSRNNPVNKYIGKLFSIFKWTKPPSITPLP
ncbi:tetratricopeptide repeat protein [Nitrospirota bacterium]